MLSVRWLTEKRLDHRVAIELFKITLNGDPALRRIVLDIVVRIWRGGEVPQQWKDAIIMVLHK